MPSMANVFTQIGQVAIPVADVKRATRFYRDVLGMKFLFEFPGLAFFDCGGVRLMLSVPEKEELKTGSVLYYKVTDIEGYTRDLKIKGVVFDDEPHLIAKMPDHDLWMAFFRDSERNILAMMEERVKGSSREE